MVQFYGAVVIYIGVFISTSLIYLAVHKYGHAMVEDIVPEEKLKKVTDILESNSKKMEVILFVLFFLPVVPKDFLTYVGSLLPMSMRKFLFITIFGDRILDGDVRTIVLTYAITYTISLIIVYIYNKNFKKSIRDKKKMERKKN